MPPALAAAPKQSPDIYQHRGSPVPHTRDADSNIGQIVLLAGRQRGRRGRERSRGRERADLQTVSCLRVRGTGGQVCTMAQASLYSSPGFLDLSQGCLLSFFLPLPSLPSSLPLVWPPTSPSGESPACRVTAWFGSQFFLLLGIGA